jgi:DNA-binding NtrC family response regulator
MLPGDMDGFGLIKWLRPRKPQLPIVLTSGGHNAARAAQICKDEPFFSKPYDINEMTKVFEELLKQKD